MIKINLKTKYTELDYKNRCDKLGLKYIGYHKKKSTMVDFVCFKHMDKGVQSKDWGHFRVSTYGCPYCAGRYKETKDIIPLIKNKDVEIISEYTGNEKPIRCRCKKCKSEWVTKPKCLITNGSGCHKCGREKADNSRLKTNEQFVSDLSKVNPNIEVIGKYIGTHKKVRCRCKIDGCEWYAIPANLLNRTAGCPFCNITVGERILHDILKSIGIDFIPQYTIKDCVHIHTLKFDAFDTEHNIAFEYNGEQHYHPVDFAGNGLEWANEQFELTVARDTSKLEYCEKHDIPIIIIPYWERDNMECFILNKLKELKISINN